MKNGADPTGLRFRYVSGRHIEDQQASGAAVH